MANTPNYNLKKVEYTEIADIPAHFNGNMDMIDTTLKVHDDELATKETPTGAQQKADTAEANAKGFASGLIGSLGSLLTTAKDSIVAAVNEIFGRVDTVENNLAAHKAEKVSDVGGVHGLIYEKGIWTPTLMFGGNPASDASFTSEGSYVRIGDKIHCNLIITITDPGTVEGSVQFGGLPFSIGSRFQASVVAITNFALPTNVVWLFLNGVSDTRVHLYGVRSNATSLAIMNTDIVPGTRIFETQFSYYI